MKGKSDYQRMKHTFDKIQVEYKDSCENYLILTVGKTKFVFDLLGEFYIKTETSK